MKFEYLILEEDSSPKEGVYRIHCPTDMEERPFDDYSYYTYSLIAELGEEGWEMFNVIMLDCPTYYFKREKRAKPTKKK